MAMYSQILYSRLRSITMSSLSAPPPASSSSCRALPGEGNQVRLSLNVQAIVRINVLKSDSMLSNGVAVCLRLQVQPRAPLLQILRVAGAQEDVFTLKEVRFIACLPACSLF